MPMPPPSPSSEGKHDRLLQHEIDQLVRALVRNGPQQLADLADLVGAAYWEPTRFDQALAMAVIDARIYRTETGAFSVG